MIDEWRTGRDLEGSSHGIAALLAWYLPGGTEAATKILSQVRWCPGWDLNQGSPEYKSRAFTIAQTVWFLCATYSRAEF